jgi:5'-nucleotidase/UDP-sugar diphosphatase
VSNVGGVARMAYILQRERARSNRVIHLNAGDYFEGAPIFNFSAGPSTPLDVGGAPEMQTASAMNTDAAALGNHEFDYGSLNAARQIQAWADFPVLAANYQFYDTTLPNSSLIGAVIKPFTVLDQDGLKIAIIGMGNLSSLGSIFTQPNSLGILPLQTEETAQFYVDLLRPYVDLVVVLSHLGINADEAMVQGTTGIDIVAGGHNHIVIDPPQLLQDCSADPNHPGYVWAVDPNIPQTPGATPPNDPVHPDPRNHPFEFQRPCKPRNVLLMQSGAFSKYVGRLDAVISNDPAQVSPSCQGAAGQSTKCVPADYEQINGFEVVSSNYQVFPITATVPEDPVVSQILQPYQRFLDQISDLTVLAGFAPQLAKRIPPQDGDSPLGNLVSASMWLHLGVQTDFAMTNSSGIRADLNAGPVPIDELYDIFPFDNTITTMELSGVEVRELFDFVARRSQGRGCLSQAQVAGARLRLNCNGCDAKLRPDTVAACNSDSDCTSGAIGACNLSAPFMGKAGTCLVTPCAEAIYIGQETDSNGKVVTCGSDSDCAEGLPGQCYVPTNPAMPCTGKACGICWLPIAPATAHGVVKVGAEASPGTLTNVYSLATNNYIAGGGSGFKVLQRNTTQLNTNILQRNALIDFMRQGKPCGWDKSLNGGTGGLPTCSVDKDCATGFVCACPGDSHSTLDPTLQTCTTAAACGAAGACVRQDCRDQVAQYHLIACSGAPGNDVTACQNAVNPCSVGGEECKFLACVDASESALVDNRITVIR